VASAFIPSSEQRAYIASPAGSFWEETMLRFVAIGLCAATALTSHAVIAQTDQLSIPSATGASTPAQAAKQSAGSGLKQLKDKGNLAKQKAGASAEHARKNVEHVRKMTANPSQALKPQLTNPAESLKTQ
jgi:hypothetical protein